MDRVLEIRTYTLKPGTRAAFHDLFVNQSLPLLKGWRVDVVAYGSSLHDEDSYYLMRAYISLEDRKQSEETFYGSQEWMNGPREAVLALIDHYTTVVIAVNETQLRGLRGAHDEFASTREF